LGLACGFQPWRTIDGVEIEQKGTLELETLMRGVFERQRFLDLLQGYVGMRPLNDELKAKKKTNLVQADAFSDKLEKTVSRYRNRAIQTVEVIEELISLAKEMKAAEAKGAALNLSKEETAFYDALAVNESAVAVLGDTILTTIARDLAATIRTNVSIDWTQKESVRAKLRTLVRRKLRQYGYPPDMQEVAVDTVLKQAELMAADWS
jgi:type I restriction enzyme, R subunit